jgi:hypothetical protein
MNLYNLSPLLSLFSIFFVMPLFGQDYQSVYSGRTAHFEDYAGDVQSIRIDSIHHQGDSILYPFRVIQEVGMNCFSLSHASWIGEKVIITDSGHNLFFNKNGDTITLKPQAMPGDSWVIYQKAGSLTIRARVTTLTAGEVLGMPDSVKTVKLQAYDREGQAVNHPVNSMEIQLSQHFGFLQTLNFAFFPDLEGEILGRSLLEYKLIGLSKPRVGIQNLSWRDVHDFQIGDVLHVREESRCWPDPGQTTVTKSIITYLERADYADSIVYHYALEEQIEHTDDLGFSVEYSIDTLIQTIHPNPAFDQLPGQPVIEQDLAYQYYMNTGKPLSKTSASGYESFYQAGDSCWEMSFVDGCLRDDTYYKGLGGPFYFCMYDICNGIEERKLVYYEKSDTVWGMPLELTSSASTAIKGSFKVYPNPADESIFVNKATESLNGYHFIIYTLQGVEVRNQKLAGAGARIDISDLASGMYLLHISKDGQRVHTEKVVIQ